MAQIPRNKYLLKTASFYALAVVITLTSCRSSTTPKMKESPIIRAEGSSYKNDSGHNNITDPTGVICMLNGSTTGEIVQICYKTAQWHLLMNFISEETIRKFGTDKIISAFQNADFGFNIKLKSYATLTDGSMELNYQTLKFGTIGVLRVHVRLENDTCKVILHNIYPKLIF